MSYLATSDDVELTPFQHKPAVDEPGTASASSIKVCPAAVPQTTSNSRPSSTYSAAQMIVDLPEQASVHQASSSRMQPPSTGARYVLYWSSLDVRRGLHSASTSSAARMLVDEPSNPSRSPSPDMAGIVDSRPRDHTFGDPLVVQRRMNWARGLAHAFIEGDNYCVTALNTTYVPRLVLGNVDIALRSDGRFGVEDPLNWPQLYCPHLKYLPFIPNRPGDKDPASALWHCPQEADFIRANDDPSGHAFGYLTSRKLRVLHEVVAALDPHRVKFLAMQPAPIQAVVDQVAFLKAALHNTLGLFAVPSTYRGLVALWGRLHRCWCEYWAFMRWYVVMRHSVMANPEAPLKFGNDTDLEPGLGCGIKGAYTLDPSEAQKLYAAGVPVWYIQPRHTVGDIQHEGRRAIGFTEPHNVVQHFDGMSDNIRRRVRAGEEHLVAISRESEALLDIEHVALPAAFGLEDEEVTAEQMRGQKGKGKAGESSSVLSLFTSTNYYSSPARHRPRAVQGSKARPPPAPSRCVAGGPQRPRPQAAVRGSGGHMVPRT